MLLIQENSLSEEVPCSYLPDRMMRNEFFFAMNLAETELNDLLSRGWRKFGFYFFKPACRDCRTCIPLRVRITGFTPGKSQRRILKKNSDLEVRFGPLQQSKEIFEIYREHSVERFGMEVTPEDFMFNFYQQSCPGLQSEFYLDGGLAGVGYLDRTNEALSTVYFIYRMEYASRSPGIFSILKEIELARDMGLEYYYLGYYVPGCGRMEYKGHFSSSEVYSWTEKKWAARI